MVINYVPGEECRVAIVEEGKLEEYYVERFATASRVGNIYVGRVTNVEPAIQAAFVDFGVEENGFLHVSDIHPRYFPGEDGDTTERVGLKTPRRERPPIQRCLKRGDEVIVQVLKEGVGTKGPTLTSYLSIPGRFLVMMPYMDRTGVSRKVEDEEQRRAMREILDQLELPEGFGFIVRTAGMDRNKTELKRDLAYLQRLWKDMERRLKAGGKSRLLYSESDLLVRSLRDLLTTDINEVVIDHDVALKRAARFMKIVAPRGQAKLLQTPGHTPIFHAFGIEQQVALINAREVPLPSGGRLVIDQTEALVAIDVNSGKSRESRDAETNAYQTNIEAVDEICRQLRLRDMGGIVINDLIDMRSAQHRKDIEHRFRERLKRDRARSTVLPISEFGILEMTRQRMRASHESVHFADCPTCRGRGMVQKPDSIAGDALRDLSALLDNERVAKVEMAVAPRVAGELLSTKRQLLSRIERLSGKHVDVRVSEQVAMDRIVFYAYDAQGADIDLNNLPAPRTPKDLVEWDLGGGDEGSWALDEVEEKAMTAEPAVSDEIEEGELHPIERDEPFDANDASGAPQGEPEGGGGGGRRRRRRGGRGRGRGGERGEDLARDARPDGQRQDGPRGRGDRGPRDDQRPRPPQHAPQAMQRPAAPAEGINAFAGDHGEGEPHAPAPGEHVNGDMQFAGEHDGASGAPGEPMPGGPEGGMQPQDPNAPGGGRRRRRRRRGRGRGRGGEGQGGMGQGAPMEGEQFDDAGPGGPALGSPAPGGPALRAGSSGQGETGSPHGEARLAPSDEEYEGRPEPQLADGAMNGDDRGEQGGPVAPHDGVMQGDGQQQGEGGRRRRRRRGRRGRGGNGAGGQPGGAPSEAPVPQPPQPQRRDDLGPRQGGGYRNNRRDRGGQGERGNQQREPRRETPAIEPKPAAPQPQASAPKPRLLYGAGRRKLNPSELNRRPKPE